MFKLDVDHNAQSSFINCNRTFQFTFIYRGEKCFHSHLSDSSPVAIVVTPSLPETMNWPVPFWFRPINFMQNNITVVLRRSHHHKCLPKARIIIVCAVATSRICIFPSTTHRKMDPFCCLTTSPVRVQNLCRLLGDQSCERVRWGKSPGNIVFKIDWRTQRSLTKELPDQSKQKPILVVTIECFMPPD